jgi:hypothetical protein
MKKMVYHCRLRLAARFKSGGPSLGRSPGAHKQRRPVNQDQIQFFGENRVDTIFRAGLLALLFFLSGVDFVLFDADFFWHGPVLQSRLHARIHSIVDSGRDDANQSDRAQF